MKIQNKILAPAAVVLLGAAAAAAWLLSPFPLRAPLPSAVAAPAPARAARDTVRYPADAPQLAMISVQALAAAPLPLGGEALSARVAYDEDRTARVGVNITGRIVRLKASPGDHVRAGQVLAEIDSPDVGSASADAGKARADEERKRLAYERARELGAGEGIAAKDLEAAQADYAAARAETERAQQRMRNLNPHGLRMAGQRVGLASPIDGVVSERTATPALEINPSLPAPLFVVTDPRHLWLMIDLPERLLAKVRPGSAVAVESDAYPGERFAATIAQVGQVMDPNTRRVLARARLDNPAGKLLPEMLVRATVLQDAGRGVRVPAAAIVDRGIHPFVFVELRPGEFQRRAVQLLTRGAEASYVGSGLRDGERVVVAGALLLDAELDTPGDRP